MVEVAVRGGRGVLVDVLAGSDEQTGAASPRLENMMTK